VDVGVRARLTVKARRHQLRDRGVKVTGELTPGDPGRRIAVQRPTGKGGWDTIAATETGEGGAFRARFEPSSLGAYELRARVGASRSNLGDRVALDHPVYVYREDQASYYGPGFYGNRTACGQILREGTVGVAHKRLPCGTRVRFHYRGRTRRIEVIDRGPFIEPRRWDLTEGARRQLDFPRGVDEIWADR
jgi:rare lipoprotein A (peptidoglycan hydrolase)